MTFLRPIDTPHGNTVDDQSAVLSPLATPTSPTIPPATIEQVHFHCEIYSDCAFDMRTVDGGITWTVKRLPVKMRAVADVTDVTSDGTDLTIDSSADEHDPGVYVRWYILQLDGTIIEADNSPSNAMPLASATTAGTFTGYGDAQDGDLYYEELHSRPDIAESTMLSQDVKKCEVVCLLDANGDPLPWDGAEYTGCYPFGINCNCVATTAAEAATCVANEINSNLTQRASDGKFVAAVAVGIQIPDVVVTKEDTVCSECAFFVPAGLQSTNSVTTIAPAVSEEQKGRFRFGTVSSGSIEVCTYATSVTPGTINYENDTVDPNSLASHTLELKSLILPQVGPTNAPAPCEPCCFPQIIIGDFDQGGDVYFDPAHLTFLTSINDGSIVAPGHWQKVGAAVVDGGLILLWDGVPTDIRLTRDPAVDNVAVRFDFNCLNPMELTNNANCTVTWRLAAGGPPRLEDEVKCDPQVNYIVQNGVGYFAGQWTFPMTMPDSAVVNDTTELNAWFIANVPNSGFVFNPSQFTVSQPLNVTEKQNPSDPKINIIQTT